MFKKFILIFAFLIIAQAIAYSLPGDTVWVKTNVNAFQTNFSLTGDSIFCLIQSDTTKLQIRSTLTGNIIREFNLAGSVEEFKLSPNGRKLYLSHAYERKNDSYFVNKPLISCLNLATGDTTVIIRSQTPSDTNYLTYYLYAWSVLRMSISKDEKYLTASIIYNEYLGTSYGTTVGLFDIQNKIFLNIYGFRAWDEYAFFSPTENYFAIPFDKKINLINPETYDTIATLIKPYQSEYYDGFVLITSNSSKLISYSSNNKIDIWNLSTKYLEDSINLNSQIQNPIITPDNKKIIATNYHWIWTVFDIDTKDSIYSFPFYVEKIDFSKNMDYIILNMRDSNLVLIETPQEITSIYESPKNYYLNNIYPNPSTNIINIDYPDNLYGTNIEIYNSIGISLWNGRAESKQIDVSNLATGVYFLRIGNETKMFVKE